MVHNKAILICGHGSKNKSSTNAFLGLFSTIKSEYATYQVEYGFIEYSLPSIENKLEELIKSGIKEIVIVPIILFTGVHIKYDIPFIINEARKKHPDVRIKLSGYIGNNKHLLLLGEKIVEIAFKKSGIKNRDNTNLLLIGVGSSQEKANVDIAALTRYIWEKTKINFALYSFISKMTFPSIEKTLEILDKLPQKNIVILPYLLFPGAYLDKIYDKIETFKKTSKKNIIISQTLENDELIIRAIQEKINEVLNGKKDFASDIPADMKSRTNLRK